jgi:hypothetical protein
MAARAMLAAPEAPLRRPLGSKCARRRRSQRYSYKFSAWSAAGADGDQELPANCCEDTATLQRKGLMKRAPS